MLMTVHSRARRCSGQSQILTAFGAGGGEGWRGRRKKVYVDQNLTLHEHGGSVELFCDISNPLSALCSLLLWSSCLFLPPPSCLAAYFLSVFTLNPASINLSGKLQMFWVNYVNHREIKTAKKHGVLALFHNSSRSQIEPNKSWLIKEPGSFLAQNPQKYAGEY